MSVSGLVTQSCPSLCDPTDCSPPGPSVHGILQARILEWAAISSSRGSSHPGIEPWSSALQAGSLREAESHTRVSRLRVLRIGSRVQLSGALRQRCLLPSRGQPGCVLPHLRLWRIQLLAGVGLSALLSALRPPESLSVAPWVGVLSAPGAQRAHPRQRPSRSLQPAESSHCRPLRRSDDPPWSLNSEGVLTLYCI